ncbi:MAG: trigger factor [Scytolyngbya sp. HA4215-MV1]|nr:trigger factor [Scytolyngbya sp. HA4215-MV1]
MKVTQEKLPASQVALEIEIPPEMSKQAYEQVIQEYMRSINLPGFRKGKVPRQVLIQRIGTSRIKAAAVEELIQDAVKQAVKQEEIAAIGNYQLRSSFDELVSQYQPGNTLTFSATFDVNPEVELSQYSGFTVQAEEVAYDPAQVDQVLEEHRSQMATLIPVEGRSAQLGDVAVLDYVGRLLNEDGSEGEEFPGGSAEDFQVELETDKFIAGFIDGIVGMNPGETKQISVQFPADYPQTTIAGQSASFTITLKELKEKDPPDLNDDFAQEVSDFDTLEELRTSLETRYQEEAEQKTKTNKREALVEALLEHLQVDLPNTMIQQEIDYLVTQMAMRLQNQGMDVKKLLTSDVVSGLRERSREDAIARIRRTLALGEIAKKESIQVEPAAVTKRIQEVIAQYGSTQLDQERLKEVITDELLTEQILTWLEEHSTIELVPEGTLAPDLTKEVAAEEAIVDVLAEATSETDLSVEAPTQSTEVALETAPTETIDSVSEAEDEKTAFKKGGNKAPQKAASEAADDDDAVDVASEAVNSEEETAETAPKAAKSKKKKSEPE